MKNAQIALVATISLLASTVRGEDRESSKRVVTCSTTRSLTASGLCVEFRDNSDCRLVSEAHPECVVVPKKEWEVCAGLEVVSARPACFQNTCAAYCDHAYCDGKLRSDSIFTRRWTAKQRDSACADCRAAEKVEVPR